MSELRAGVLFDVDGTLIDSNYLHALAWSRAFSDVSEWAPMHAIHRLVGMGGDQLVPEVLGHRVPKAISARKRRYAELIHEARPFPGADRLLERAQAIGLAVVLATSSPKDELQIVRQALDAEAFIDAVTTAEDVRRSKPYPDVFVKAMRIGRLDPDRTLAVGDSVWDIRAARKAGIACIGLESGGFSRHELNEDGAIAVYRDAAELAAQIRTSPLAALLH